MTGLRRRTRSEQQFHSFSPGRVCSDHLLGVSLWIEGHREDPHEEQGQGEGGKSGLVSPTASTSHCFCFAPNRKALVQ